MLKTVNKSFQTENTLVEFTPNFSSSNLQHSKEFIGYSFVKKGNIFRSSAPKFFPWRRNPLPEEWNGDSADGLTLRWRREFKTYLESTNSFMFYQFKPVKIPYFDKSGVKRFYEPFALLTYWNDDLSPRNRKPLLIDVRSDAEIRQSADIFIPAFRAASRFAQKRKLRFKIFRDKFFLSTYFNNLKFIHRFCCLDVDYDNRMLVEDALRSLGATEFSKIIDMFGGKSPSEKRGKLIRDIWTLIQRGEIGADWNKPFNKNIILHIK